jgi:hypothetical protein
LRINADGTIPSDNPFSSDPSVTGANKAIWALGLRNPYTFAFRRGTTRMFIDDVGQNTWEEIDDGIAGSNYGWPTCEGLCMPPNASFRDPLFEYGHPPGSPTTGCAITGGTFYDPPTATFPPAYVGTYFFADNCSGWIRRFDPQTGTASDFASGISGPVDLAVSSDGSLYYLARGTGGLYRIAAVPTAVAAASFRAVRQGRVIVLRWRSGGDPRVLGFDVYRGTTRLNRSPILAGAGCCAWVDRASASPTYRLLVVFADGSRREVARVTPRRKRARPS